MQHVTLKIFFKHLDVGTCQIKLEYVNGEKK